MNNEFMAVMWTLVLASLVSVSCALVGCYLVLRKLSLIGDAISHAVLPGIAIVFLLFQTRTGIPLLVGAMITGILTAVLTSAVSGAAKIGEDAGMGIVFTTLFAVGVLLMTRDLSGVDLDVDCVLMGQLELATLGGGVPDIAPRLAIVFVGVVTLIVLFWKELQIVAFDPALATAMGISAVAIHYGLMAVTAVVTVASFEAVGSILVVAMLIVPPSAAHLLTTRLRDMLIVSALFALGAAVGGTLAARWANANYAGMMAVVAGLEFAFVVIFAPRSGMVQRLARAARLKFRIAEEDVIALLYRREEASDETPRVAVHRVTGKWWRRVVLGVLRRRGWIDAKPNGMLELTEAGRHRAAALVRAHRLWEAYLSHETTLPADHLHEPAEWMEHYLDAEMLRELEIEIGRPTQDPHGRTIPPA